MIRTNRLCALLVASLLLATPANAADQWNGFYAGINLGGGAFNTTTIDGYGDYFDSEGGTLNNAQNAFVYGGQIGYNFHRANVLYGVEADISGTTYNKSVYMDGVGKTDADHWVKASWGWFATIRGRLGLVMGDTVGYVTGGLAFVNIRHCGGDNPEDGCHSDDDDNLAFKKTNVGFVAGAGVETKISNNMSLKAEYLYVDAGAIHTFYDGDDQDLLVDSRANVFRVGLNYHFGHRGHSLK